MPQTSRHRARRGLAGLTALAVAALAACAPSSGATDAGGAADAKDTLVVGLPGSLSSLDPAVEGGILNYYVAAITSEGLVRLGEDGSLQPAIAEDWTTTDATTFVFDIRQGVDFQDGTELTVDDVLYSIDRARDAVSSPSTAAYWPEVASVEQTGDWQVTITLAAPSASFLTTVSNAAALFITSRAYGEANPTAGTAQAPGLGTGPYEPVEFAPDSHATFEATGTWWGGESAYKTVRFDFIPDENTRLLARKSGDIDIALNVPLDQVDTWQSDDTNVVLAADNSYVGFQVNQTAKPFDDVHVRRAIAHAIDRDAIVSAVLQGHGEAAVGFPTPEALGGYVGAEEATSLLDGLPGLDFDLDAAKAELAQSSVPQGFSTEIVYPNTGPQLGQAALAIAENLNGLGIELTVTEVPIEQWFTTLEGPDRGLHFTWYFSTTGDPGEVIGWYLRPGNPYGWTNPEGEAALTAAATTPDPKERATQILQANALANEDVAAIPLWWGQAATAVAADLQFDDYTPFTLLGVWPDALTAH
ncbi:extracellular solute-binding protein family 5 [Xylanimonas cellulosilytica DSM 15894]|uniref:Extracellular solute-binding protein family 5 n=1 Tax=Xylanimonas cellulosilytica (strain DSM 15894 / JCM 12276 / CECT 5975 / KCTC 9989 / LMG 20990 / NBRC 107835 / XIL07) TaxID=446471 RepID=D1C0G7_XYLCX|nr:ABC transporter substrate-binding protein [Xylanimonas cellulosilytica]ACZ32170.1 extracellular solute-binding protein family 5 [Xylanimonas cellulosilytica DSM 15894]